ncbi:cupin domain-containing protein [Xanthomonas phaseoli]
MTDHPASLPALQPQRAPADLLSQLLQLVRLRGDGAYTAHLGQHYAAAFAAGVSHLHYLERGTAWLIPAARQPIPLVAGDVVVLPHGRGHRLCDDPRAPYLAGRHVRRCSLRPRQSSGAPRQWRTKRQPDWCPISLRAHAPTEGLINSPQMRDTIALCRGFIHAADVR